MRYTLNAKVIVDAYASVDAESFEEARQKARDGLFAKDASGYPTDWETGDWIDGPILTSIDGEDGSHIDIPQEHETLGSDIAFMQKFVKGADLSEELMRDHLRMLFTATALKASLVPGTADYKMAEDNVWDAVVESGQKITNDWNWREEFNNFLRRYLA